MSSAGDISKVTILNGDTYDIKDETARATANNAVSYAASQSLTSTQQETARTNIGAGTYSKPSGGIPASDIAGTYAGASTAGGVANGTQAIPYGEVDSTSTSTAFTATVSGITTLVDGTCMLLKNGYVTSAANFTIDINNLGAKPCYNNMATGNSVEPKVPTRDSTIFNLNYTMLFVYSTTLVDGGCWICYRGYNSDTNTIGYQLRTNSTVLKTADKSRYYRVFFTSADGTHWVPANTGTDNSATSTKTVNQRKINPFGRIIYYSANTSMAAEADVAAAYCWSRYAFALGYSFNRTGAALTLTSKKPIYIKCAPQSDGSAIIDSTTPYVQDLPSTADGKIYIFLGIAYSATNVELYDSHPVYEYKDGAIRLYTNAAETVTVDSALSSTSENPVQNKVIKSALDGKGTYSKPSGGIPDSDIASAATWNAKSDLTLGITSSTAYRGDYGAAAYAHGITNKGSAFSSGLYKITTNSEGHVTAATAVEKSDITGLGIPAQDTTYESKTAASGGTDVSLVTTGEKYTWNNKGTYSKPSGGIPDSDIASAATWNAKGTYSKPSGGIPDSDIASAATWNAKGTYSKPSGGIPSSDMTTAVQTSLGKADTSVQYSSAQSLTAAQKTQVQSNIGLTRIVVTNISVAANAWSLESTPTYADFPYKASISVTGATSDLYPEVVLSPSGAMSGNYAPVSESGTDVVYIYANETGAVALTIPTIIVH